MTTWAWMVIVVIVVGTIALVTIVTMQLLSIDRKADANIEHTLEARWGFIYDLLRNRLGRRAARRVIREHDIRQLPQSGLEMELETHPQTCSEGVGHEDSHRCR